MKSLCEDVPVVKFIPRNFKTLFESETGKLLPL